ncbi:MAG TPA: hypothetical protein VMZ51_07965 [Acidimicrobiales bacterium]|nr:hypothetical protein [Acidimicrobiales bacterium]
MRNFVEPEAMADLRSTVSQEPRVEPGQFDEFVEQVEGHGHFVGCRLPYRVAHVHSSLHEREFANPRALPRQSLGGVVSQRVRGPLLVRFLAGCLFWMFGTLGLVGGAAMMALSVIETLAETGDGGSVFLGGIAMLAVGAVASTPWVWCHPDDSPFS